MKIYWDAGLKDMAKLSHKHITLKSLASCSNFKRTHRFLLQVYEAIYIFQFQCFLEYRKGKDPSTSNDLFLQSIDNVVSLLVLEGGEIKGIPQFREAQENF